jgi:hypothetical protein
MYFGSEHRDIIIFLPIDGIDIRAKLTASIHRTTTLSSSQLRELPVSLYIIITFLEIKILFEVLVVIKITFLMLVLFTSSGESRTETYPFGPLTEQISSLIQGSQQIVNIVTC